MPWVVFATPPEPPQTWTYAKGFFPRTFHYKREAAKCADDVRGMGGKPVVLNEKDVPPIDKAEMLTGYVVRCERDSTVFCATPKRRVTKLYDPAGDKCIDCPTCHRGYFYMNGGPDAEGKMDIWESDRKLTVMHKPE